MRIPLLLPAALLLSASTLIAHADTITTFNLLNGTFDNGATITGTVTIDTTSGTYVSEDLSVVNGHHTYTFDGPITDQGAVYQTNGYAAYFTANNDFLNLTLPASFYSPAAGNLLVAYMGGPVCSDTNNCDNYNGLYSVPGLGGGNFDTGTLAPVPSAVPEPSTIALLGTGILGLAFLLHRKLLA